MGTCLVLDWGDSIFCSPIHVVGVGTGVEGRRFRRREDVIVCFCDVSYLEVCGILL